MLCFYTTAQYKVRIYVSIYQSLNFTHLGKTVSIRNIIQQHNSGVGYVSTEPLHLYLMLYLNTYVGLIQKNIYYYTLKDYGMK